MTRFVGLISALPPGEADGVVAKAAARLRGPSAAPTRRQQVGQATVAWRDRRGGAVARHGSRIAVVDGLFYNPEDLPAGDGPADVLLKLLERKPLTAALGDINGDFALAVYDEASGELSLARDRFGLRPLYYAADSARAAFASTPAGLFDMPGVDARPNPRFLGLFGASHYRTIDNDRIASPYRGIAQVAAGDVVTWRPGGNARSEAYWALQPDSDWTGSEEELAEAYRALLLDAVERRLNAVEEPGFTLSGGMDSSTVLGAARHVAGRKPLVYTSVYDDPTYDEREDIAPMLDDHVGRWHPVRIGDPDLVPMLETMIREHEEPVATATWLSHHAVVEAAAENGHDALFGGLGGDELNAGEFEYFLFFFADLRLAGEDTRLKREIDGWIRHHDHPVFRKSSQVAETAIATLTDQTMPGRCLPDRARIERYAAALNPDVLDLRDWQPRMDTIYPSYLKNRGWHDIFRETAPCCLRASERNGAGVGIDTILPFFDHRLVEFMFRVPGQFKFRDGVTKHLLRLATKGLIPEETRTRVKKTGWNAPAHVWFAGPGREVIADLIASRRFRERGIYNLAEVDRLLDEHLRIVTEGLQADNHMMFFWQLLNLELWLRWLDETV